MFSLLHMSPQPPVMPCVSPEFLSAQGEDVAEVFQRWSQQEKGHHPLAGGVVVIIGDDRGMSKDDEDLITKKVEAKSGKIQKISLGGDVLFASHCIVLLNHYLDKMLHSCKSRPHREYSTRDAGAMLLESKAKWEAAATNIHAIMTPRMPEGHIVQL